MREVADESWMQAVEQQQEKLFVRFGLHPKKDEEASRTAGRPIFTDTEYVEIMVPGDKQNIIHRPVTSEDRRRFARQYDAWLTGKGEQLVGTPLAEWPGVTRSQ